MTHTDKSFFQNANQDAAPTDSATVTVVAQGPYMVKGTVKIQEAFLMPNEEGTITKYRLGQDKTPPQKNCALCRCGKSKNKPFCDGKHSTVSQSPSTAPHEPILKRAEAFQGPDITLYDNEKYCAFARFCDGYGRIWNLVRQGTAFANTMTVREAHLCPAGRFVLKENKTGAAIDIQEEACIQVIEDPMLGVHGPLGLRGNITVIDENGTPYEKRRLQALCRCGKSKNKPFCDGTHAAQSAALKEED